MIKKGRTMRYILALILAFAAHGAYANCGPTLEIGPEFEIGTSQNGGQNRFCRNS